MMATTSRTITEGITGTDDSAFRQFAPEFAPTIGKTCTLGSILDKIATNGGLRRDADAVAVSAYPVKRKDPLTTTVNRSSMWAAKDSNLRLPPCEDGALTN
jgi:hypothetical protein